MFAQALQPALITVIVSAQAAAPPLAGGPNQHTICHISGGWKSKVEVQADLVSGESWLPGSAVAVHSPCPYGVWRTREHAGISCIRL